MRVTYPDGSLRPYERNLLLISLYEALGHRTDALAAAESLEANVTGQLLKQAQGAKLTRQDVIQLTHTVLRRFDQAAAVYYHARHH